jgi:chromosome segregation ATPase
LPAQVAQAFVAVWQQAINLAQAAAEAGMAEQRQILDAERERVAAVENQAQIDSAKFRQQANEAVGDRKLAETRLADLDLLLEQRREQIDDLQQQRDGLVVERDEALRQIQKLQQDLLAAHQKNEQDRSSQEAYVRGVEDRAHREVDRAREETKEVTRKNKEFGQQMEVLQGRLDSKAEELSQAQQQAAAQKSRADTLEAQLQRQKKPSQARSARVKK